MAEALFTVDTTVVVLVVEGLIIVIGALAGWIVKYIIHNLQTQLKTLHSDFASHKKTTAEELKDMQETIGNVNQNTNDINVTLPSNYVSKLEFGRLVDSLFGRLDGVMASIAAVKEHVDQRLDKMNDKLDRKQDKSDV